MLTQVQLKCIEFSDSNVALLMKLFTEEYHFHSAQNIQQSHIFDVIIASNLFYGERKDSLLSFFKFKKF